MPSLAAAAAADGDGGDGLVISKVLKSPDLNTSLIDIVVRAVEERVGKKFSFSDSASPLALAIEIPASFSTDVGLLLLSLKESTGILYGDLALKGTETTLSLLSVSLAWNVPSLSPSLAPGTDSVAIESMSSKFECEGPAESSGSLVTVEDGDALALRVGHNVDRNFSSTSALTPILELSSALVSSLKRRFL